MKKNEVAKSGNEGNMIQKKLSERIAERAQKQDWGGRKQQYQAIFLSLQEEIEEAHRAGWKVKPIWETLHLEKKFEGTYECFLSYFNKIIRRELDSATPLAVASSPPSGESGFSGASAKVAPVPSQDFSKNFTHNPVPPDLKTFL